jgi:hypothetical protein
MAGVYSSGSSTSYGTTNAMTFGNTGYATHSSSFSTAIYKPTSSVGVTVIMFHGDEAGGARAFEAAQVLRQMNC